MLVVIIRTALKRLGLQRKGLRRKPTTCREHFWWPSHMATSWLPGQAGQTALLALASLCGRLLCQIPAPHLCRGALSPGQALNQRLMGLGVYIFQGPCPLGGKLTQRCVFFTGSQSSPAELSFSYPQSRSACSRELYQLTFHLFSLPHFLSKYLRYHFPNKALVPKFSLRACFWKI